MAGLAGASSQRRARRAPARRLGDAADAVGRAFHLELVVHVV